MICSCDRPMPLEDGNCLKCGRETAAHAELMRVGQAIRPLVDEYIARGALLPLGFKLPPPR